MSKSVLFLCGSPRGKRSASLSTARYLAQFLDHDYEFVDVARARLSTDPEEAEPAFLGIVEKMRTAGAVFWTFGAWGLFVSVRMQVLLDKLFTQEGHEFGGKLAAAVLSSVGMKDDLILDRVRFFSEQLGFGYLGDVSAVGNPFWGYTGDAETTEESCRILAGQMNRALADGYVPARHYPPVERRYLSPRYRGSGFVVDGPAARKDGDKTILVITGHRLAEDPANAAIVEAIRRYSRNRVEIIALQDRDVGPCVGCYLCDFREEGVCVLKDEYEAIKQRLHEVEGIVYLGTCASGLVDCYLKAFLERTWGISHRPSLKGRYGFAVATGGGPLEAEAARHLRGTLNGHGARCIAALTQSAAGTSGFAATLRRTVEDLDRALDEEWQIADRFSSRAKNRVFRDLVAENGMVLRADYGFYKEHKMFDVPSAGGLNAILWWLFRSEKLRRRMMTVAASRVAKAREKRLAAYLQSGGRQGKGDRDFGSKDKYGREDSMNRPGGRLRGFWRQGIFSLTMIGCVLFVLLTIGAMLSYPGGTLVDPTTSGYSFLTNYFSDLGLTWSHARQPNTVSAILFITALTMAGGGLVLFFLAFPRFFTGSRWGKILSGIGSTFGVIAGLCFVGVALTPANLYLGTHLAIMMWAFRTFTVAVICYTVAIFREPDYPNVFGFVFVAFGVLLVLYVLLLIAGPPYDSPEGIMIQAVGQKIIVYASVICVFIQAKGAKKIAGASNGAGQF